MNKKTHDLLKALTGKSHIRLVSRGNKAILYALRIAKKLGKAKVSIQDQGGWITYKQFPSKLRMDIIELKTDYGIIPLKTLQALSKDSVLLVNSFPGYFAEQDMKPISDICRKKNCLLINDISGSIGTKQARYGDIVVCSFGKGKPVDYGTGGFIAAEKEELLQLTAIKEHDLGGRLYEKLLNLEKRLSMLKKTAEKIKKGLHDMDIIHRPMHGINVIVKTDSEKEKKRIEDYCKTNGYEYILCPRYIRVSCNAVSIEVKRLG
ncbi:DegT/DnrJ/EryC1/StrS family aminotransferase [Candidatus Woesearchaeota archaeon]|nr:DegT/DnrJ/EryC1/StrS family aminotransferase [Candidatus Woesearchaeota archaeon]